MPDKLLYFSLSGYPLAVEPEQIEKILINKHPTQDTFVLETGVEVKSLKSYIPLPEKETTNSGNIFFVKEQKDFYGFTVDRVVGYLKLMGSEKIQPKEKRAAIKYFVRNEGRLIPVLDLQYITNHENSVASEDIEEIANVTLGSEELPPTEGAEAIFHDVSEEDIYRSIDEELQKRKSTQQWDDLIRSEKKGMVLPLIVNIVIIALVSFGLLYYVLVNKVRIRDQKVDESIAGVEEEVIREIRRRSEAEIAAQKQKLEDARKRLESLQEEKDYFLQNQDEILQARERELNEAFQLSLEEAKQRIATSGVTNVDDALERERERLYEEYLDSRDQARLESESEKRQFEEEMKRREAGLQQEVNEYTERIDEVEQKLQEEQVKLKQAEERFQSMELEQQEYRAFRQQINGIYNDALGQFTRKNYSRGIERLKAIPPILRSAKEKGIGDSIELKVEEDLVNNILYLAEREQNRLDLDSIGQKTLEAAILLEKEGKTKEALSRYFTVYTVSNDDEYKKTALERADVLMDRLFRERNIQERRELVKKADVLFNNAMVHKQKGEFEQAMGNLEEIIKLAETPRSKKTLEEIISIDRLWANSEEEKENRMINQKTSAIVKDAKKSYDDGYYADALAKYEDVIKNYKTSKHSEQALSEIIRINEEMRGLKITPPRSFKEGESDSGVIIQVISGGTMLFNLGSDNNINQGDVLQVYRKEENEFTFIGTLKVYDVFPRLSRGKIVYSDKQFKIGDVVAF
jgi:hypothetical protein